MTVSQKSLVVILGGAVVLLACSSDDTSGSSTSSSGGSSSGGSSSGGSSSGASGDAGGGKANGEACMTGADCASTFCETQGAGSGKAGSFCSIKCDNTSASDPKCAGAPFSGKCSGQGYCQIQ